MDTSNFIVYPHFVVKPQICTRHFRCYAEIAFIKVVDPIFTHDVYPATIFRFIECVIYLNQSKRRSIMTTQRFTQEEIDIIAQNPYVVRVCATRITYSLAFKKFALKQANAGIKSPEIFRNAGFDPEMLGKPRMYAALKKIKIEAASPEGLHEPRGKSKEERMAQFAKEDYSRKHTKVAIRELQNKIVHLEQQIEFLKKIQSPEP